MKAARHALASALITVTISGRVPAQGIVADPLPLRIDRMFRAIDSATTPGCVVGVARDVRLPWTRTVFFRRDRDWEGLSCPAAYRDRDGAAPTRSAYGNQEARLPADD